MTMKRKQVAFGDLRGWIEALKAAGELHEIRHTLHDLYHVAVLLARYVVHPPEEIPNALGAEIQAMTAKLKVSSDKLEAAGDAVPIP